MENLKLGQIIKEPQKRDAIHIAVAPCIAGRTLLPGMHVGFQGKDRDIVVDGADVLFGIVDPFLKSTVSKGERFWVYLYPGSIQSIRHDWEHPEFYRPSESRLDGVKNVS